MKTFISDIIPKIQSYSDKLDNHTLLMNQHWVLFDDTNADKKVYIFRSNNQLLISNNGKVEKGKWESIGNNSILIDLEKESYLFRHGFFDESILALKLDGKNEYVFMVNESRFSTELNSYEKLIELLRANYLNKPLPLQLAKSVNSRVTQSSVDTHLLKEIQTEQGLVYLEGNNDYFDGQKIFASREREALADGKYKIGFMYYIHVENGVVKENTLF